MDAVYDGTLVWRIEPEGAFVVHATLGGRVVTWKEAGRCRDWPAYAPWLDEDPLAFSALPATLGAGAA